MRKSASYLSVIVLLVYYLFTSGYWFWFTDCKNTYQITTPFSWALSAEKTGLTGIATQDDINCMNWILDESDKSLKVLGDSNTIFLLSGNMELLADSWKVVGREDRMLTLQHIPKVGRCYIFLNHWNARNSKYIEPSDVGLRRSLPIIVCDDRLTMIGVDWKDDMVVVECVVREAYRSGESVVYEKVGN